MQTVVYSLQMVINIQQITSKAMHGSKYQKLIAQFLLCLTLYFTPISGYANVSNHYKIESVEVCERSSQPKESNELSFTDCEKKSLEDIKSNNKLNWLVTSFSQNREFDQYKPPLGIYLSAKAATEIYLNGHLIDRNGQPSDDVFSLFTISHW